MNKLRLQVSHTFGRIIQLVIFAGFAYQSKANLKLKKKFFVVLKGYRQFENINFTHQFLAKGIPTINNAENLTQSMNVIGENFLYRPVNYTQLDPMPQDGLSL